VSQVLTIARLTILEASRRKLLLALGVLTVAVIVLTSWGFSRLPTMSDVVDAAAFLLENPAVNGVDLVLDGGWR